ncbi:hypothetical protein DQ240_20230 [Blastococcus sp. TF02A-26]|nr:hypothetical protein DQ240_20230 [Blastococcus sp. TF02A-26]
MKAAAVAFLSVITATEHYAWALLRAPDDDSIRGKLAELHEQRGLTQLALALATEREDVRRASREVRRYAYRSAENAKLGKGPKEPWVDKNGDDTLCPHDGLTNNKRALAAALAKELDVEDLFAGLIDD